MKFRCSKTQKTFLIVTFFVFSLCIYQYVQSGSTAKKQVNHQHKQLENVEELNEKRHEKEMSNIYSSSKANNFLSYDTCMQRMKCPVSRKEECSEECHAGNTEEEIEEHTELTMGKYRDTIHQKPKARFETNDNYKKQSNKIKHTPVKKQQSNNSTIKTDL